MAKSPEDKSPDQSNPWRMAGMGLEFAGAALLLGLIGYYIDLKAGTGLWFTLTGLGLGLVGGMYRFIKEALAANRQYADRYRREHPGKPRKDQPDDSDSDSDNASNKDSGNDSDNAVDDRQNDR